VCTILAVFYLIGLTLVGVPYAVLLGLVGGYGQIIPYMGLILAMFPAMLLALLKYGDLLHPLLAGVVYVVGQMLEGSVITPRIMSGKVGLHPVVVIISILVFGKILGFLGILIAVPLTTVLLVLLQEVFIRYKKSSLYRPTTLDVSGGTGDR
jgi:predicted PurR-regulated permease PerM